MSVGAKLGWIVAVCVALVIGLGAGIWIGGEIESDVQMEILSAADLPAECWDRIAKAAQAVAERYEHGGAADAQ